MRSKSSFRSCTRPMGWFWALPFKTRQKKLTRRQTALSVQTQQTLSDVSISPPNPPKSKQTTTSTWNCCPSSGGRRPSHLLPSPQPMCCQYWRVCSRTSGFNMPLHKTSRCSAGAKKSGVRWLLTLCLHPGDTWGIREAVAHNNRIYIHVNQGGFSLRGCFIIMVLGWR